MYIINMSYNEEENIKFVRDVATNKNGELICDLEGCGKPIKKGEAVGKLGTYHKDCYSKKPNN